MAHNLPVTAYALLGLLTFGDELTGYELKQRADITLRFYWVSPAMSQIYSELARLAGHGLVATIDDGGGSARYRITAEGTAAVRAWMADTPAGFPVLKHPVALRLLMGHLADPGTTPVATWPGCGPVSSAATRPASRSTIPRSSPTGDCPTSTARPASPVAPSAASPPPRPPRTRSRPPPTRTRCPST
jgi:DNA-binding PadR family transcriptional regulator